tara:strand:+ start:449 stop:658 length:210 start_codon:yes stop_codon:yes gene_type:complete
MSLPTVEDIETKAKEMYYHQRGYKESMFPYMWGQCSEDYKEAWRAIAKIELEEFLRINAEMHEREYNSM